MRFPRPRWRAVATAGLCAVGMMWATPVAAATRPIAELSVESASGSMSVTLVANSSRFGPVVAYFFQFGDGTTVTTTHRRVVHTYSSTGSFTPEVTETDAAGNKISATGTLELNDCPLARVCTETLANVSGISELIATGPIQVGVPAAVDLFAGPYKIPNCQPSVNTDGALTDSGFTGNLTVTAVYLLFKKSRVNTTCFSSVIPFVDAQGNTVKNGPLPKCAAVDPVSPCVVSLTTVMTTSGLLATKVLLIPPNDPKVGAL